MLRIFLIGKSCNTRMLKCHLSLHELFSKTSREFDDLQSQEEGLLKVQRCSAWGGEGELREGIAIKCLTGIFFIFPGCYMTNRQHPGRQTLGLKALDEVLLG